jgi:hypothetical protein
MTVVDDEEIDRFIAEDPTRLGLFEKMVDRICSKTRIDRELLRKYSEQAIGDWEAIEDLDAHKIMSMNSFKRKEEINKIMDYFQIYITPIMQNRNRVNQTIDIATRYYQKMFNCEEPNF